jgi:hypothetical protein
VVRQGDYLTRLAWIGGFDAEEVWKHEKNKELAELRKDHNILAPGDVLQLPVKKKEGVGIEKGGENKYKAKVPRVPVRIRFHGSDGPLADAAYVVEGPAIPDEGTSEADGLVALEVAASAAEIRIRFPDASLAFTVRVGHLDPIAERSGVASRLAHLGFLPPAVSDQLDAESRRARGSRRVGL